MERYTITRREEGGVALYVLSDREAGFEAHVAPALGHNCLRYRARVGAEWLDVLAAPADMDECRARPTHFGNPVLAPYPNRVRDGRFAFAGRTYSLPHGMGGHAIHGLVLNKPWHVVAAEADAASAWIEARFDSDSDADVADVWPFPFSMRLTYRLREGVLWQEAEVVNTGDREMPFGYGIHPWFNAPLGAGDRADVSIEVPAGRRWELEGFLPTGRLLDVEGPFDRRRGGALGAEIYDDVFTDLVFEKGWCIPRLRDPKNGWVLEVGFDKAFRELVVYAPGHRATVCFEPYTCTTDALNLQPQGVDAGLIILAPGAQWRGMIYFALERS